MSPEIKIIGHARERGKERGASEEEIRQTIESGKEIGAKKGRKAKEKIFVYNKQWLGKEYVQKKIQAIYVEERGQAVIITVKVFYGNWGEP